VGIIRDDAASTPALYTATLEGYFGLYGPHDSEDDVSVEALVKGIQTDVQTAIAGVPGVNSVQSATLTDPAEYGDEDGEYRVRFQAALLVPEGIDPDVIINGIINRCGDLDKVGLPGIYSWNF
jgi:hypothetical protein